MIYITKSGSRYEISADRKQMRVLHTTTPAALVGGEIGKWRTIEGIYCKGLGFPLCIVWPESMGAPQPATVTTAVVECLR